MNRYVRLVSLVFTAAVLACGGEGGANAQAPEARWEGEGITRLDPTTQADGATVQVNLGPAKVGVATTALLRILNVGGAPLALEAVDSPETISAVLPESIPPGAGSQALFTLWLADPGPFRMLFRLRDAKGALEERIRFVGHAITEEDPGTDDPGTDDPGTDDPGTDDPGTDDPGTDDPGTDDPGTDDPGTDDPGTDDPGTDDPEPACWARTDSFLAERKIDVLWVADNSGTGFELLVSGLWRELVSAANGVDYQVGMTTTGLFPSGACPGGANGGENGRLFPVDGSSPRIITSSMPMADQDAAWRAKLVGECHYDEQPYEAARRALSPPLIDHADDPSTPEADDGNLGLLRPDADLAIVFLTDERDQSTRHGLEPLDYAAFFQSLKPGAPLKVKLHAIVGPRSGQARTCWAEEGDRLLDGVDATGGSFHDLCTPPGAYSSLIASLSQSVFSHLGTTFTLTGAPRDNTGDGVVNALDLQVFVDGFPTPPLSASRAPVWTYDPMTNSIRFNKLFLPAVGSSIQVTYAVPCETQE